MTGVRIEDESTSDDIFFFFFNLGHGFNASINIRYAMIIKGKFIPLSNFIDFN